MAAGERQFHCLGALLIGMVCSLFACSSHSAATVIPPVPVVTVTLSPAGPATVNGGSITSVTATVTGATTTGVTWSVDSVVGGNATVGTLTGSGNTVTYTAPVAAGTHTLQATSLQDTSKTASLVLTVQASSVVSVALSPAGSLAVLVGGTATLTATVTGTTNTAVTWTVDGITGGTTTVGTLVGSGNTAVYAAPATAGAHTLVATSVQDPTRSASVRATVQAVAALSVTLSPSGPLSLYSAGTMTLTATVSGTTVTAVTWMVDSITNGNATVGTLAGSGNTVTYAAPLAPGAHIVTATSVQDGTKSASVSVTVLAAVAGSGIIVAPTGLQGNPGTLAAPTTLEGAQTLIQKAIAAKSSSLTVLLRGGVYPRSASLSLGAADSGAAAAPVQWAAYPGEQPRLVGGVSLPVSALQPVTSADPNWSRLDASSRALIYVADLSAYKSLLGSFSSRPNTSGVIMGGPVNQAMEVFANGVPLNLARYPKYVDATAVKLAPQASISVTGTLSPDVTGTYAYGGLDTHGNPYYKLAKGGDVWSIAMPAGSPSWLLSDSADFGGKDSVYWGSPEGFSGPAGRFEALSGASGTAFLSPADGSSPLPGFLLIQTTNGSTQITVPSAELSKWKASEAMYYGLSNYSWWGDHCAISAIDGASGTITLANSPTLGIRIGQPCFIYNLLEELTAPGDYFIDRVNARLYLRPNGDVAPTEVLLSTLQTPILKLAGCTGITWQGVSFEADKDVAVSATNCQSVSFNGCQFWNSGGYGLVLSGSSNLVEGCDFRQLGQGGVWVWGGNRSTLTPSGTLIENSQFQSFGRLFWTYQPAIQLVADEDYNAACMGITVQHNEIHNAPHDAIIYGGNGNTIQYNKIYNVDQWTNDAGAIYSTGCEWGTQGNLIQFNLIRNCGGPLGDWVSGIYLDAGGSGSTILGNILYKTGAMCAIQHNGGRDVQTQYNVCYGSSYGIDISNVTFSIISNTAGSQTNFLQKLQYFNYQSAPWSTTYPNLAVIPNTYAQLPGTHWLEPENSICYGNLQFGGTKDVYRQVSNYYPSLGAITTFFKQVGANVNQDPLFTNPANLDFTLQSGSPMFAIPGFPGINTALIGIQK